MKLNNSFQVPAPVEEAWPILLDVERIVPCMPGAELVEIVDKETYKGKVSVRLGPVTLAFDGMARFTEINAAQRSVRMEAMGTDKKGRGGANAKVMFQLQPKDNATTVLIDTDLQLSGSVAQYGRGSGMIADLAAQLVGQFSECLGKKIKATATGEAVSGEASGRAGPPSVPAAKSKPISGIALGLRVLWNAVRRFFNRLLGRS